MNDDRRHDLDISELKTGDLLLSMADSQIAKLIAWLGGVDFSHASVVYDADRLIEATPKFVQFAPLAERVRKTNLKYIDVLRPAAGFSAEDEQRLRAYGEPLVGRDYAIEVLAPLALAAFARKAATFHPLVHRLLKWAIDQAISSDPASMVCTELAYRLYDEPAYEPARRLELRYLPVVTLPFPLLNPIKLAREIKELLRQDDGADRCGAEVNQVLAHELEAIVGELEALGENEQALAPSPMLGAPDDGAFAEQCAARWRQMTADAPRGAVNPKTVLLWELWNSRSFNRLGRLRMYR